MLTATPTIGHRKGKITFLSLPLELRQTIYDLALPRRHLYINPMCAFRAIGPIHLPHSVPSLFFTTYQIYSEAAPVFYSKATLCFHNPPSPDLDSFLTKHLLLLPQHVKSALRTARISASAHERGAYSSPWAYHGLLGWLALDTGITDVNISKLMMLHACKRHICRNGEAADLLDAISNHGILTKPTRTIKVFSSNDREFWEGRAMGAGRGTIVAEQAPGLRMFVCIKGCKTMSLICDPRGTPKGLNENSRAVGEVMDELKACVPSLSDEEVAKTDGEGRWLFQVVFVLEVYGLDD